MPFVRLRFVLTAAMLAAHLGAHGQAAGPAQQRDVFVVGRETAIGNPLEGFRPTRVEMPSQPMDVSGRRELTRMLLAELCFAHQPLPLGAPGLDMHANGRLTVDGQQLQKRLYEKGMAADRGDRVMVTDITVLRDRIQVDVNGGPYLKHRFLRHISVNDMPLAGNGDMSERATGTRITLLFEGPTPRVTAAELKALLEPLLDFRFKDERAGLRGYAARANQESNRRAPDIGRHEQADGAGGNGPAGEQAAGAGSRQRHGRGV